MMEGEGKRGMPMRMRGLWDDGEGVVEGDILRCRYRVVKGQVCGCGEG